jgi:hypothetical protein
MSFGSAARKMGEGESSRAGWQVRVSTDWLGGAGQWTAEGQAGT